MLHKCGLESDNRMLGATATSEPLSERQRSALISLLADDDMAVYHTIRSKILSYGQPVSQWLRPYTLSSDPVLRRRAHEIVNYLARQQTDNRFLSFCLKQGDKFELEDSAWLLAQTQYPEINVAAYQALMDSYAGELRERVDFRLPAE